MNEKAREKKKEISSTRKKSQNSSISTLSTIYFWPYFHFNSFFFIYKWLFAAVCCKLYQNFLWIWIQEKHTTRHFNFRLLVFNIWILINSVLTKWICVCVWKKLYFGLWKYPDVKILKDIVHMDLKFCCIFFGCKRNAWVEEKISIFVVITAQ